MTFTSWSAIRRTGRPTVPSSPRAPGAELLGRSPRTTRATAVRAVALCIIAACASQPAAPPQNVVSAAGPHLTIGRDQPLGWIGLAPRPTRTSGDWLPAGTQAVLVPMPAEGLTAGTMLSAIDTTGNTARVTAGAPTKVPYGCDGNQLDVVAFTGAKPAPGPVWLLPPTAPAIWRPRPIAIQSPAATEAHRRDTVGPLALDLERSDAAHGTLTIARDGRVLHRAAIARAPMEGADPDPLDFTQPGVAIPIPVAAWSFVDGGPILLVLRVPSYEGTHLTAILVEEDAARELPALATYLYRCAF